MPKRLENCWSNNDIQHYLDTTAVPMRLACHTPAGYPQVVSIWYLREGNQLVGITHQSSHLMRLIKQDARVGFEVAVNEPPYRGIRGFGDIEWGKTGAQDIMQKLVNRYLDNNNDTLARWLMSRVNEEMVLRVHPVSISSWDYRKRMHTTETA